MSAEENKAVIREFIEEGLNGYRLLPRQRRQDGRRLRGI